MIQLAAQFFCALGYRISSRGNSLRQLGFIMLEERSMEQSLPVLKIFFEKSGPILRKVRNGNDSWK
jgi:hypothetical protein